VDMAVTGKETVAPEVSPWLSDQRPARGRAALMEKKGENLQYSGERKGHSYQGGERKAIRVDVINQLEVRGNRSLTDNSKEASGQSNVGATLGDKERA